jgi:hypothetical protein
MLELRLLRQAEAREFPTRVRREEIPVSRADMAWRRHASQAAFLRGNFQFGRTKWQV